MGIQYREHEERKPGKDEYPELAVGAWIHARTIEGHLVSGFVYRRDADDGTVLVGVCHACCSNVGATIWANMADCDVATDSKLTDTEGYIRNMIDFAIDTRDERSFKHYTEELRKLMERPTYRRVIIIGA